MRALEKMAEYGLGKAHPAVARAAELLLSSQANDGGIADLALGETPESRSRAVAIHFQGWALSTLCRTGYDADARVDKGFRFLLANRQADGGWAWRGVRTDSAARPSSHLVTGMALRAFAASATRKTSREARRAAELLATRFLQPDRYPDRKAANYWEQLGEPRFYTDVLDALDCVTAVGLGKENSGVRTAEAYVRGRQNVDGLWYPGRAAARRAGRQAAAAQRQGSRAGALAHRTRPDCLAPRELTGLCSARHRRCEVAPFGAERAKRGGLARSTNTRSPRFARSTTCRFPTWCCARSSSTASIIPPTTCSSARCCR